jgi:hypothetical protein
MFYYLLLFFPRILIFLGTSELTFVASQHIQENELMTINYLENPRLTGMFLLVFMRK